MQETNVSMVYAVSPVATTRRLKQSQGVRRSVQTLANFAEV